MLILSTEVFADEPFIKDFSSMEMSPMPELPTPPDPPKQPETPEEVFGALKQHQHSENSPPKKDENKAETYNKNETDVTENIQSNVLAQQGKIKEIPQTGAYIA